MKVQITFDAIDPSAQARFWCEVLGYRPEPPPEGFERWTDWLEQMEIPKERWNDAAVIVPADGDGPRIFIQRIDEPKVVKNRVHLDVDAAPRGTDPDERWRLVQEAAERAVSLGARTLYEMEQYGTRWITLADPEGNEFCIQ